MMNLKLIGIALAVIGGLFLGLTAHLWNPFTKDLNPCGEGAHLMQFEDGSGTCFIDGGYDENDDRTGKSFPADTFPWNCHTMGNRICGPTN